MISHGDHAKENQKIKGRHLLQEGVAFRPARSPISNGQGRTSLEFYHFQFLGILFHQLCIQRSGCRLECGGSDKLKGVVSLCPRIRERTN